MTLEAAEPAQKVTVAHGTSAGGHYSTRPFTGEEYIESLRDGREVWFDGERVKDVTTHPAFRTPVRSIARLYDALHDPASGMVTVPTDTGNGGRTHPFFKVPYTAQDLVDARNASAHWARMTYGWMGRTPDYKAAFTGSLGVNDAYYAPYDANARRWYQESQEKVLYWNHALANPPVDRHLPAEQIRDVYVHVEKETDNGLVVSGAKIVATGSAMTHMNFIAHVGAPLSDPQMALVAGIPMDSPGMKLIARQSYAAAAMSTGSAYDYPLSSRFDENDSIMVLDRVLIPWENVFVYGDLEKVNHFGSGSGFGQRLTLQGATRLAVKLDFIAGLMLRSLSITGARQSPGVRARLGEVLSWRDTVWSLSDAMAFNPEPWIGGAVNPNQNASNAYRVIGATAYTRVREIVMQDLGSALIYLPSNARDFDTPELRGYLDTYVRGSGGIGAEERVKTLKMLWDAVGTEFGGRHELYERNYQGNHETIRQVVYQEHERLGTNKALEELVDAAMADYDRSGWLNPDYR